MSIDWTRFGIYRYDDEPSQLPDNWLHVVSMDVGGYEWSTLHAFYSPTARLYFWYGDSGCSCNSWGDKVHSEADFENGDKDALKRALSRFADSTYSFRPSDLLDAAETVNQFQPPPIRWR